MKNPLRHRQPNDKLVATALLFLLLLNVTQAFASAGGGGGGGSDSDGGGAGALIYLIIRLLPFPYNLIALAVIIVLAIAGRKKARTRSGLNRIASFETIEHRGSNIPPDFYARNPEFNEQLFRQKVTTAFVDIQQAWMKQDLRGVRRWISDGVWQRFNTQFLMMQALGQRNNVDEVQVGHTFIDAIETDGPYDVAHVGIHFTMRDDFVTDRFPELNQEGYLENVEYWTFIRKKGVKERDLYHSQNCPSCGNQLDENMGEVSQCKSCGTVTTLGDYDWILSEITQADDYANQAGMGPRAAETAQRMRGAMPGDRDFSRQLLEDKASNAYMQILSAHVTLRPERMRRFTDDRLYDQLSERIKGQTRFVYNRLFLNSVTLMDYYQAEGKDHAVIAFKRTAQKVDISTGNLRLLDAAPYASDNIMVLARDNGAGQPKGSLYAHRCPSCGGPLGDTLDMKCGYCGSVLNSTKTEWIVERLEDYHAYKAAAARQQAYVPGTKELDPLFKARDYAFNNVLVMIGIDGELHEEEIAFANSMARSMGYNPEKVKGMLQLARQQQLKLRMPEDKATGEKVLKQMMKAAAADSHISPEEKALLDEFRERVNALPD